MLLRSLYAQVRALINDEARVNWDGNDPLVSEIQPVYSFLNLADAPSYVEILFTNTLAFFQRGELHPPVTQEQTIAAATEREKLIEALRSSCDALDAFVARDTDGNDNNAVAILCLYHILLSMRLHINAFGEDKREAKFDDVEQQLEQMLDYCRLILQNDGSKQDAAQQPVYSSSGLGVVAPLHTIASRCHNVAVRQEAISLLRKARRREWLWDSTRAEKVVSTTMELELKACAVIGQHDGSKGLQKVPHNARIREVKFQFEGERNAW